MQHERSESAQERRILRIKVINSIFCFACVLSKEPADWKLIIESIQQLNAKCGTDTLSELVLSETFSPYAYVHSLPHTLCKICCHFSVHAASVERTSSVSLYSLEHLALTHLFTAFLNSVKSVAISLFLLQVWNGYGQSACTL